jgi:hypothetical protein
MRKAWAAEPETSKPPMPKLYWDASRLNLPENAQAAETETIIDSIVAFLGRFVFLKDDALYLLVAVWIVATYLCQEFDYTDRSC